MAVGKAIKQRTELHYITDLEQKIILNRIPHSGYQIRVSQVIDSEYCNFSAGTLKIKPSNENFYYITYWHEVEEK